MFTSPAFDSQSRGENGFINPSTAKFSLYAQKPSIELDAETSSETRSRTNSDVSFRSVASELGIGISSDTRSRANSDVSFRSVSSVADADELASPLLPLRSPIPPEQINHHHCSFRSLFGPKTLAVMSAIGSIVCALTVNLMKLSGHTYLGLMIASAILLVLAVSIMINELVGTTRGSSFR